MQTVANKAKPVAAELMQNQVLPRMKQGQGVDGMAQVSNQACDTVEQSCIDSTAKPQCC